MSPYGWVGTVLAALILIAGILGFALARSQAADEYRMACLDVGGSVVQGQCVRTIEVAP
ncbi:hypothetical protein [Cellulosimicrobium cellulans]|uniref:hypothetical protein n=1 Tax=Cellulosimicrobium cellulans TaxID=1710 RepID=UPI003C3E972B